MKHGAFPGGVTPDDLLAWFRAGRERSKELFAIPVESAYYERPISLRNPIVFYEGHLPAFSVNTLIKLALRERGINEHYEKLFERGIDPEDEAGVPAGASLWPQRADVQAYGAEADALLERALVNDAGDDFPLATEARFAILEHEQMHHETFLYMLHNLGYEKKNHHLAEGRTPSSAHTSQELIAIPPGIATLGADRNSFGWDNEFPQHRVSVDAFSIQRHNVTNGEFMQFVEAGGYRDASLWSEEGWQWIATSGVAHPHFWLQRDGWWWRGMFKLYPLPMNAPVYVTHAEAEAYARWKKMRLPTEAEYHRAAFGTPDGGERAYPWGDETPDATRGNFDLSHWDPVPVGSYPQGASAWGVHDLVGNGWEWTSTIFDGFEGFEPMPTYRVYSSDFFDGKHYVMKGASPATARHLVRRSFRNWFRATYPYVYATFRCVK